MQISRSHFPAHTLFAHILIGWLSVLESLEVDLLVTLIECHDQFAGHADWGTFWRGNFDHRRDIDIEFHSSLSDRLVHLGSRSIVCILNTQRFSSYELFDNAIRINVSWKHRTHLLQIPILRKTIICFLCILTGSHRTVENVGYISFLP